VSRTRRSAWNVAAGAAYSFVSAAAGLVAAPLLLYWLGAERLGAFRALSDWLGYVALFELGIGGAMMASLAWKVGVGDRAGVTRMLAAGLRSYRRIAIAQLVAGGALVLALPWLMHETNLSSGELRMAGVAALGIFVFTPLLVFRNLSEARQRGYRNLLLLAVQAIASTALCLFAAYQGWGLVGQTLAVTLAQLPTLLVLARDGYRDYGVLWSGTPGRSDQDELWSLSWPTLAHGLTDRIGLHSDNILIAWIMGPKVLASFLLTQQLAVVAQAQLKGLGAATWAGLTELHSRGDAAKFEMRLMELTGIVSGLGVAMLTPIAAFNQAFVRAWVGDVVFAGEMVSALACFNALLWAVYALWGWALLGAGQIRRWVPFAALATSVNIVGSVVGTMQWGMAGPLLGTSSSLLLVTAWALPRTLHQAFGIAAGALWQKALAPLRWGVPYAVALWVGSRYWSPEGWLELMAAFGVSTTVGLRSWWKFSVGDAERREWNARLRNVFFG
jgi:O-antigen/teichoic acid export membrane protein